MSCRLPPRTARGPDLDDRWALTAEPTAPLGPLSRRRYMTMLNTLDGVRDQTGASDTPWARWTREWTAEENRHGDLLNKYLYLTGKVDMRQIEVTIQNLIGSGMNPKTENNPYLGFMYTSFQERATKISHGNTGRLAAAAGDKYLQKVCAIIAGDEARHEKAYCAIMEELFGKDPDGAMLAFADMMRKQIVMPAHMMNDLYHQPTHGRDLFADFSSVAEQAGVYDADDYADIIEHLISHWDVPSRKMLTAEGQEAQDYVCALAPRIRRLAARSLPRRKKKKKTPVSYSWLYGREVDTLL